MVLGYLGGSKWLVYMLQTRREAVATTAQLSEIDAADACYFAHDAAPIRVNNEVFTKGDRVQVSENVSAVVYPSFKRRVSATTDPGRPGYVMSIELSKGTRLTVLRDDDHNRDYLSAGHMGPKVRAITADGLYVDVPRSRIFMAEKPAKKGEQSDKGVSSFSGKPRLTLVG